MPFIAKHLHNKGLPITVSPWVPGQLYVVSDSPKSISSFLSTAHGLSIRDYLCISDEEREAVERARPKLPNPGWVRITQGKYRGDIGYIYNSEQLNDFVAVLIPPREFPYPALKNSAALFDRSRLPANKTVSDILRDGKVIGCSYKGEQYYMGLLLKIFRRDGLEIAATPHPDCIWLHLQSGWNTHFVKATELAFSMQFLRVGDDARVITGEVHLKIGKVVSTNHAFSSVCLEIAFEGHPRQMDFRLQDVERVFRLSDLVRVVAGIYLGLEGHIIQMYDDVFHVCQESTKEEVEVSKYYLDRCPLTHALQSQLPMRELCEPPPTPNPLKLEIT
ncbi:hypothetical protein EV702DRAFT_1198294 [Suillus placidus]|uniref:KOW domain-containing protein n=1 Tax=Suillus placidus TaxID=48579 RepID=A0A9P6ZT57_9AGAM|nr:hypothetical protein EV702DRAFT_1198294 [Suillus placidus]